METIISLLVTMVIWWIILFFFKKKMSGGERRMLLDGSRNPKTAVFMIIGIPIILWLIGVVLLK